MKIFSLKHFALCIIILFTVSCGSTHNENTPGAGSASFSVVFEQPGNIITRAASFAAAADVCVDYGIANITAKAISIVNGQEVIQTTATFACSAHQGKLSGIPVGNVRIRIEGADSGGAVIWSGDSADVIIQDSQDTPAGSINMSYKGTDTTKPTVVAVDPAPSSTNVPVNKAIKVTFSEPMAASTINQGTVILIAFPAGSNVTTQVTGSVTYDAATKTATLTPSAPLGYSNKISKFGISVGATASDMAGNPLGQSSINFPTEFSTIFDPGMVPQNVKATPGDKQVTLTWDAVAEASGYNVYLSTSSGATITNAAGYFYGPISSTTWTYNAQANGTKYYFVVTSLANNAESKLSAEVSATPTSSLPTGLISYWNFDIDARDNVGTNNGTPNGVSILAGNQKLGTAAAVFSSTSNTHYIAITNNNLPSGNHDRTIAFWIKPAVLGGTIMSAPYYSSRINPTSQVEFTDGAYTVQSSTTLVVGNWYHVVITYDSSPQLKLYLNGLYSSAPTIHNANTTAGSTLYIGVDSGMGAGLSNGTILDELVFWNRALSASEITQLYNGGAGLAYPF